MAPLIWLAAGASSRMGQSKVLMPIDGEPWLSVQRRALQGYEEVNSVVLVVGDAETEAAARSLFDNGEAGMIVMNPDPSRGPLSSLQIGLRACLEAPCFVSPIDVPVPSQQTFAALLAAVAAGASAAIPTFGDRGGHPVLLGEGLMQHVLAADPASARLDGILRSAPRVERVATADARVAMNLNTAQDLERFTRGR